MESFIKFNQLRLINMNGTQMPRTYTPPDVQNIIQGNWQASPKQAVFRREEDFIAGSLAFCSHYWETHILAQHPEKAMILSWIKYGVTLEQFLNRKTHGTFKGQYFNSKYPPTRRFNNYAHKHKQWVNNEIEKWLKIGAIKKVTADFPHIVSPLSVNERSDGKLRLCFDGRYINMFMNAPHFNMETVASIPSIAWKGMFMFSLDHTKGYFHVPFHSSAWKYFCFNNDKQDFCFLVLNFGWSPCAYIYSTIHGSLATYVKILTNSPLKIYIDDSFGSGSILTRSKSLKEQLASANTVLYIYITVSFSAGFFLNLSKSVLRPVQVIRYLGIMIDSFHTKFYIPEDRVDNLLVLINKVLENNSGSIKQIESIVGKCRSMSIAVPAAKLYTRAQYAHLALLLKNNKDTNKQTQHPLSKHFIEELSIWTKLKTALINGTNWYGTEHTYVRLQNTLAHTDASSRRWAGLFQTISHTLTFSEDFSSKELLLHINEKEALALYRTLFQITIKHPNLLTGKKIVVHVDNQTLHSIFNRGGSSKQSFITAICKNLFWLQIHNRFHLDIQWVPSERNQADSMTREQVQNDILLNNNAFLELWKRFGPFHMDLMASSTNTQRDPSGKSLPFYSRYYISSARGTDVFSKDIGQPYLNYCFPPFKMLLLFLTHLRSCRGSCLVIMPQIQGSASWILAQTGLRSFTHLPSGGVASSFTVFQKNSLVPFQSKHEMIAALIEFSL